MAAEKEKPEGPLSSEALKRDEWRGHDASPDPENASGHTLPASEEGNGDRDGGKGPNPLAGTMLPPD